MTDQPTTDPRAAQIEAVRDVLGSSTNRADGTDNDLDELGGEVVDAVHAAGRDQLDEWRRDYNKLGQLVHELRLRADQGEARGYARAVANLTDADRYRAWWRQVDNTDDDFVRMPARRALAGYLEAVGPDGAPALGSVVDEASLTRAIAAVDPDASRRESLGEWPVDGGDRG